MTPADIPEALAIWQETPGVSLSVGDSPEALTAYLQRNDGCSFVARVDEDLVGVVLAGHDGRRGYLHHVTVVSAYRRQGIARAMVERCLEELRRQGITRVHLFVAANNHEGQKFWKQIGWRERSDLNLMSITLG